MPRLLFNTFNSLGKNFCKSKQIPENILLAKTAEALGVTDFDQLVLSEKISEIRAVSHSMLQFVFHNGHTVAVNWQNPSRRESWTEEMKQEARERQLRRQKR